MKMLFFIVLFISIANSSLANIENWQDKWQKTDFSKSTIDLRRVVKSGQQKDTAIPIDNPQFSLVDKIDNIKLSEPVISININGEARAYPLRILIWHEIVNDNIAGIPIAITYSPLSSSAFAFERKVGDKTLELGLTGMLYNSNSILYDRKTQSWWQQYTGKAILGEQMGNKLKKIPLRLESLGFFKDRFPKGKVLIPNQAYLRDYGSNPYPGYDELFPFLYNGEYKGKLPKMTYLIAIEGEAWPLGLIRSNKKVIKNDIIITWQPNQNSALNRRKIDMGLDVGNVIVQKKLQDGRLEDVIYNMPFAFAFDAFYPEGIVHYK